MFATPEVKRLLLGLALAPLAPGLLLLPLVFLGRGYEVLWFMVEAGALPPGAVAQTFQKGYVLNERLLRPALVVVARHD